MIETPEYAAMLERMIRAYGRRVADADEVDLARMGEVARSLEVAIAAAVAGQREAGASWSRIGRGLGISKQAAQQRYGRVVQTDASAVSVDVA